MYLPLASIDFRIDCDPQYWMENWHVWSLHHRFVVYRPHGNLLPYHDHDNYLCWQCGDPQQVNDFGKMPANWQWEL